MRHLQQRTEQYFKLSSEIAHMDNDNLLDTFDQSEFTGWGRHHTMDIGSSKVFVKRVPVTAVEYANIFSTKNLYDLPTYYNYGVGSAGLGVFRELVTHIKTTNWVLQRAQPSFPLMYHYRIMPFSGRREAVDMEHHKHYVDYWGSHANIGKYLLDRANASHELVLFLEHIPYILGSWLVENPARFRQPLAELWGTIDFLRQNGLIHFDAH